MSDKPPVPAGWEKQSSNEKTDVDAMIASFRQTGETKKGQQARPDRVAEKINARLLTEATAVYEDLATWFQKEIKTGHYTRRQGYFAASLLVINLRQSTPADAGGTAAFDHAAYAAKVFYESSKGAEKPKEGTPPEAEKDDYPRGAALAQKLLEHFDQLVREHSVDRWAGHFVAAQLSVELRSTCPSSDGGAALFDAASTAAWKYYNENIATS